MQIPHYIFVGEDDLNDPVGNRDNYDDNQSAIINTYFGSNPVKRSRIYQNYLHSIKMQSTLKVYPFVGHDYTRPMIEDAFDFFNSISINTKDKS